MRNLAKAIIGAVAMTGGVLAVGISTAGAASLENAGRLADIMGLQTEIDRAIGDAVAAVRAQLVQQGAPAEKTDAFVAAFRDELDAGAPVLMAELTRAYADRFSDAEISEMIRFYETPAGRKLVDVQHDLALAQSQAVARWIAAAAQNASNKLNGVAGGASV